ncbi:hypothetical protein OGAPHI_000528 [Ogataea philodendri]|uniref:Uncharacterized protein n=1 Tax=Ogataea philodendri TaxID=1378263 RepID=A0A9P8PGV1_9ASCO|nr:uncharacterized protein OGAPHI_000528 [Ogataea philodendri]KAH3671305.1 hypothetical protein OGAPHI_000528 [Ogataea philodendri]
MAGKFLFSLEFLPPEIKYFVARFLKLSGWPYLQAKYKTLEHASQDPYLLTNSLKVLSSSESSIIISGVL